MSSCLQQCKNYKNPLRFSRVMITKCTAIFLWFIITVYKQVHLNILPHILYNTYGLFCFNNNNNNYYYYYYYHYYY